MVHSYGRSLRSGGSRQAFVENRPKLMEYSSLESAWKDGPCDHAAPIAVLDGLRAALSCPKCEKRMEFLLVFGRYKTFNVSDGAGEQVGAVSATDAARFIRSTAVDPFTQRSGIGPGREAGPKCHRKATNILKKALKCSGQPGASPTADFGAAWRGIECKHYPSTCHIYGNTITLDCAACGSFLKFTHSGDDMFETEIVHPRHGMAAYGLHGVGEVFYTIVEFAAVLVLPDKMADRMSDDPERDARDIAKIMLLFERNGMLDFVDADGATLELRAGKLRVLQEEEKVDMECPDAVSRQHAHKLSAMLRTRAEFSKKAGRMAAAAHARGAGRGGNYHVWRGLEAERLEWPCWFVFPPIMIVAWYDPDGESRYCVRCGFSTLDDCAVAHKYWTRGCPECGYGGYLLGLKGWRDGKRVGA